MTGTIQELLAACNNLNLWHDIDFSEYEHLGINLQPKIRTNISA